MGFALILAGMVFLFNPAINVVDPLPDFIGYLLIVGGLSKSAALIYKLDTARDYFWKLALITIVKLLSAVFLPFTDDGFTLILVFSFAVIELMCIYPAFNDLFEGLSYSGMRYEGKSVFSEKTRRICVSKKRALRLVRKGKGKLEEEKSVSDGKCRYYYTYSVDKIQRLRNYTLFFMTLKLVLNVLPEVTSLQLYENFGYVSTENINYSAFMPMFLTFAWFLTFIFGIPWLVRMIVYLCRIMKDTDYIARMQKKYSDEILTDKSRKVCSNMNTVLVLIGLGIIFTFDLYIDHVN